MSINYINKRNSLRKYLKTIKDSNQKMMILSFLKESDNLYNLIGEKIEKYNLNVKKYNLKIKEINTLNGKWKYYERINRAKRERLNDLESMISKKDIKIDRLESIKQHYETFIRNNIEYLSGIENNILPKKRFLSYFNFIMFMSCITNNKIEELFKNFSDNFKRQLAHRKNQISDLIDIYYLSNRDNISAFRDASEEAAVERIIGNYGLKLDDYKMNLQNNIKTILYLEKSILNQ